MMYVSQGCFSAKGIKMPGNEHEISRGKPKRAYKEQQMIMHISWSVLKKVNHLGIII